MAVTRRSVSKLVSWLRKNRPSGVLSGWLTFFIVSYIVIVKLDASGRQPEPTALKFEPHNSHEREPKRTHILPTDTLLRQSMTKGIPKEILDDFANDRSGSERNARKLYGGTSPADEDSKEPMIDLVGAGDNEMMLFHEMEGKQDEIEENWSNYLDKNKNVVNVNMKPGKNLRLQGGHANTGSDRQKRILPKLPKHVHVFDAMSEDKELRNSIAENKCILLKTLHGDAPICIHDPDDDELISSHLSEHGAWEPNFLYITGSIIKLEPELLFLDLGCNLGVYTILAAKLGAAVVAVDPNKQNLRLLTKSLSLGNVRDKVTLLRNAVSDKHENVTMVEIIGNVGGTFVETADANTKKDETLETIMLDDLAELFKHKEVFIKMDVETYEGKVLQGANKFFDVVDVRYILMEWIAHRNSETAENIIEFLTKRDIYPHVNNHHNTKLEVEHSASWPDNVLWIKY